MGLIVVYVRDGKKLQQDCNTVEEGQRILTSLGKDCIGVGIFPEDQIKKAEERTTLQVSPTATTLSGVVSICPVCGQKHMKEMSPQVVGCITKLKESLRGRTKVTVPNEPEVVVTPEQWVCWRQLTSKLRKFDPIWIGIRDIKPLILLTGLSGMVEDTKKLVLEYIAKIKDEMGELCKTLPEGPFPMVLTSGDRYCLLSEDKKICFKECGGNGITKALFVDGIVKALYYPRESIVRYEGGVKDDTCIYSFDIMFHDGRTFEESSKRIKEIGEGKSVDSWYRSTNRRRR